MAEVSLVKDHKKISERAPDQLILLIYNVIIPQEIYFLSCEREVSSHDQVIARRTETTVRDSSQQELPSLSGCYNDHETLRTSDRWCRSSNKQPTDSKFLQKPSINI